MLNSLSAVNFSFWLILCIRLKKGFAVHAVSAQFRHGRLRRVLQAVYLITAGSVKGRESFLDGKEALMIRLKCVSALLRNVLRPN